MTAQPETPSASASGVSGEDLAFEYLCARGYRPVLRNFRGRYGEIDIIALDGATVCFVEVKTRRSSRYGEGYEFVSAAKQQKMIKTALYFLKLKRWDDKQARFDVISILKPPGETARVEHIPGAFDAC